MVRRRGGSVFGLADVGAGLREHRDQSQDIQIATDRDTARGGEAETASSTLQGRNRRMAQHIDQQMVLAQYHNFYRKKFIKSCRIYKIM